MSYRLLALGLHGALALLMLAGCATRVETPENLTVGARPAHMTPGPAADYEAAPQIDAIWLSSLTLERGGTWSGEIATPSNVASIEVRTDSFSFSVPRVKPGIFAFSYAIPDLPPYLRRHFVLHVVARNAAGDSDDEELPIEIL
jgi:hypothetical protein